MINKKKGVFIVVLLLMVVFIRLFSSNAQITEAYYSTGLYPFIAIFFRKITGWLPFSLGDLLYSLIVAWLLWKIYRGCYVLINKQFTRQYFLKKIVSTFIMLLIIYIAFNLLWGINYNRLGIAKQLNLKMEKYSHQDLLTLNSLLLQKVNQSKAALVMNGPIKLTNKEIFNRSATAYDMVSKKYAFLQYTSPSVKTSMWGWLGNYIGFTGYYNPLTGEAQVNTVVPKFLRPYITCHEIGHQLGYAKENEANFVGYLAASSSKDSLFLYSTYLDLFLYSDRNLYSVDTAAAKSFARQLSPAVKADLNELNEFYLKHQNPVEPFIRWMYGKYLQSNQQPSGVLSYDDVTGFLIAYYKKYGEL